MTILVLELRAPDTLGPGGLAQGLFDLRSRFATFVISFIVLGVYWFAHHQVFHFVLRVNRTLVWLNILFLMGIALVPFAASVMGAHTDDSIALSLYGAVLGLLAALGCPFFRNPQNYMSAGGFVGYVQHLISVHRKA